MKKYFIIILIICSLAINLLPMAVYAQQEALDGINMLKNFIGLPSGDIRVIMSALINQAISLMGIVFVVIILYAGFLYLFSMGDDEKIQKAKSTIFGGIIGLVIIFTSYSIASFVINSIREATMQ